MNGAAPGCSRCGGLLVPDRTEPEEAWWRCVSCGDVIDAVITRHRHVRHLRKRVSRVPRVAALKIA